MHIDYATPVSYLDSDTVQTWADVALRHGTAPISDAEICVRIVDESEMTELNSRFRDKHYPTNVLSFPADLPEGIEDSFIGDIAICAPVVEREALEQCKDKTAHWAHMVVHGCLHLVGMDHERDEEAADMEETEIQILADLGFANPYTLDQ